MSPFTLKELTVFVAVAEHGSVTHAASAVALTQSAASQALDKLEASLNVKLFDRIGRRLILNEQGRVLLPRALSLLDKADELSSLFDKEGPHLRIGASSTIANYLLPACLARFKETWPQAELELEVGNTQDIVDAVAQLRVDFGFIEGLCHHPELSLTPWQEDELVIFSSPIHPWSHRRISLEELAQCEWLLREPGSGTREEVGRLLFPYLPSLNECMALGHSEAIKHTVAAGLGVSCLSRRVIEQELSTGTLIILNTGLPPLMRTLFRIQHRKKTVTRGMASFYEITGDVSA